LSADFKVLVFADGKRSAKGAECRIRPSPLPVSHKPFAQGLWQWIVHPRTGQAGRIKRSLRHQAA
jgi:hypothetical protein